MAVYYFTVIIQESEPTSPQTGWVWIKESIQQAYIYLFGQWIPFAGA